MPLRPPHEVMIDGTTRSLRVVHEHPTLNFKVADQICTGVTMRGQKVYEPNPEHHPEIRYQEGAFYLNDGRELPLEEVPPYIIATVREFEAREVAREPARPVRLTLADAEAVGRGERAFSPVADVPKPKRKWPKKKWKPKPKPAPAAPAESVAAAADPEGTTATG